MNYLVYVNCVDVCLGVGSEKFIQMLTFAENNMKRVQKSGKHIFTCEEKKKKIREILDYFSYGHSLPTIF